MEGTELPKSGKNQNIWRKRKLLVLGNIGRGLHQTDMKGKMNEKTSQNQALQPKSYQRNQQLGNSP